MRALTCAVAALAITGACRDGDGGGGEGGGEATGGAPAGEVRAVSGDVTAARDREGAEPRPLEVGGEIYANDVIATGEEASVRIELEHNRAMWELSDGEERRVDESLAWRAPESEDVPEDEAVEDTGERTAVAGRHAERSAAETGATALYEEEAEAEPESDAPAPSPSERVGAARDEERAARDEAAPPGRAREPEPEPERRTREARGDAPSRSARGESAQPAPEPGDPEDRAPGSDAEGVGVLRGSLPDAGVREGPSRTEDHRALRAELRAHIRRCFEEESADRDDLRGRLDIRARIDERGRVERLNIEVARGELADVPACARRVLEEAELESHERATALELSVELPGS